MCFVACMVKLPLAVDLYCCYTQMELVIETRVIVAHQSVQGCRKRGVSQRKRGVEKHPAIQRALCLKITKIISREFESQASKRKFPKL